MSFPDAGDTLFPPEIEHPQHLVLSALEHQLALLTEHVSEHISIRGAQDENAALRNSAVTSEWESEAFLSNHMPTSPTNSPSQHELYISPLKSDFSQRMRSGRASNPARKVEKLKETGEWLASLRGERGLARVARKRRGRKQSQKTSKVCVIEPTLCTF